MTPFLGNGLWFRFPSNKYFKYFVLFWKKNTLSIANTISKFISNILKSSNGIDDGDTDSTFVLKFFVH